MGSRLRSGASRASLAQADRAESATGIGDLHGEMGFIFTPTEEEFAKEFRANADTLVALVREFVRWLREQLRQPFSFRRRSRGRARA